MAPRLEEPVIVKGETDTGRRPSPLSSNSREGRRELVTRCPATCRAAKRRASRGRSSHANLPRAWILPRVEAKASVGAYKRVLGKFRDRYVPELEPQLKDIDRRLIVAFAIGLDALQDR